ncbi:MAG: YceI family protein [Bdellovibrionota bacterium]
MKIFILAIFFSVNAFADTYKLDSRNGEMSGLAIGKPSLMKIKIEGPGPSGVLTENQNAVSGFLTLNLKDLKTGIDLRDRHMKEKYLEIGKFPEAQLHLMNLKIIDSNVEQIFTGNLVLKGESKPVSGTYKLNDGKLLAKFTFSIKDYPIATPKYLGIEVTDKVEIEINSKITRE